MPRRRVRDEAGVEGIRAGEHALDVVAHAQVLRQLLPGPQGGILAPLDRSEKRGDVERPLRDARRELQRERGGIVGTEALPGEAREGFADLYGEPSTVVPAPGHLDVDFFVDQKAFLKIPAQSELREDGQQNHPRAYRQPQRLVHVRRVHAGDPLRQLLLQSASRDQGIRRSVRPRRRPRGRRRSRPASPIESLPPSSVSVSAAIIPSLTRRLAVPAHADVPRDAVGVTRRLALGVHDARVDPGHAEHLRHPLDDGVRGLAYV
mmetsp:Transcript_1836/g.8205  ORF Transcript_1836/g.8205 Transcript_1836/m.8205 type:complete len:263 (+) Transcript_1836:2025-2813(+)